MPCYVEYARPASRSDYEQWKKLGFLGSWDRYCEMKASSGGVKYFIRGDLGPHCAHCAGVGDYLCDYPVGENKTCDAPLCETHAKEIGENLHYCPAHAREWQKFVDDGGAKQALSNVIPLKR